MVRLRATHSLTHVQSNLGESTSDSEDNDAEDDCAAKPIAADGLTRQATFRADCQEENTKAISRDEVCS